MERYTSSEHPKKLGSRTGRYSASVLIVFSVLIIPLSAIYAANVNVVPDLSPISNFVDGVRGFFSSLSTHNVRVSLPSRAQTTPAPTHQEPALLQPAAPHKSVTQSAALINYSLPQISFAPISIFSYIFPQLFSTGTSSKPVAKKDSGEPSHSSVVPERPSVGGVTKDYVDNLYNSLRAEIIGQPGIAYEFNNDNLLAKQTDSLVDLISQNIGQVAYTISAAGTFSGSAISGATITGSSFEGSTGNFSSDVSISGALAVNGSATTTFSNGINLPADGCFAVNGTCITPSAGGGGGGSGTVTSVNASGGSTGLSFTGGAITTSGTLTLSGILSVASGGTGWSNIQSGAVLYGNGAGAFATTTAGSAGNILAILGGVPTWTATTTFNSPLSYSGGSVSLGNITVANGGTGQTTFSQGWISSPGGTGALTSSTSPTVAWITATSTNATSTFNGAMTVLGMASTSQLSVSGSATSTFTSGINVKTGCFSVNSTCIGAGGVSSGTQGQSAFYNAAGGTVSGTSTIFIATNSTVGIGTTTPQWLLQVAGTRPSIALSDTSATTNQKHWLLSSIGGTFYIGTSTDNTFATSTPSALTVTNAGNFGIGTSSPGSLLSIGQTANFTTGTSTFASTGGINLLNGCFSVNGVCTGKVSSVDASGGTTGLSFSGGPVTTTGTLTLSGTLNIANGGTGATTFSQGWISSAGGTGALTSSTSPSIAWLTATSTSATSTFNGAVAVLGMASTSQLSVSGSATSTFTSGINVKTGCFSVNGSCVVGTVTSVDASGGTTGLSFTGGPITSSGSVTLSGTLNVSNGGTGAATFSQGWISSPGGTGALTSSTSPTVAWITATSTTRTSTFPYASTTAFTSASSAFLATGGGNVGIGTTTANWLLQMAGTRPSFALSDTSAAANQKHWLLSSMGGNLYIGTSTDAFSTSTSPAMTFSSNLSTTTVGFFVATSTGLVAGVGAPVTMRNMVIVGDGKISAGMAIVNGGLCIDTDGWCNATTSGSISYVNSTVGQSDVAEIYTSDNPLEQGDVVAISSAGTTIRKADQVIDGGQALGIVSSNPGIILGLMPDQSLAGNQYPIALAGRIPTKVSDENGPISPGDFLTLSSIPGVAMRADHAGNVIAQALEGYSQQGVGKIMAFVKNSYYAGSPVAGQAKFSGPVHIDDLTVGTVNISTSSDVFDKLLPQSFIDRIIAAVKSAVSTAVDWTFAKITAAIASFDSLTARTATVSETLCVGHTCLSESQLQAILKNSGGTEAASVVQATSTAVVASSTPATEQTPAELKVTDTSTSPSTSTTSTTSSLPIPEVPLPSDQPIQNISTATTDSTSTPSTDSTEPAGPTDVASSTDSNMISQSIPLASEATSSADLH